MFNDDQKKMLDAPLSRDVVKTRSGLSYVEGWHVLAEANRIFGFDGWSSETVDAHCVNERGRPIGDAQKPGWGVTYVARVRITVDKLTREGSGAGHGISIDLGLAHESAIKEAETDARKRALMTFGNPFGLALYDKTQANVADEVDLSRQRFVDECKASIARIGEHPDKNDLLRWWNSEVEKKKRRDFDLSPAEVIELKGLITAKVSGK